MCRPCTAIKALKPDKHRPCAQDQLTMHSSTTRPHLNRHDVVLAVSQAHQQHAVLPAAPTPVLYALHTVCNERHSNSSPSLASVATHIEVVVKPEHEVRGISPRGELRLATRI